MQEGIQVESLYRQTWKVLQGICIYRLCSQKQKQLEYTIRTWRTWLFARFVFVSVSVSLVPQKRKRSNRHFFSRIKIWQWEVREIFCQSSLFFSWHKRMESLHVYVSVCHQIRCPVFACLCQFSLWVLMFLCMSTSIFIFPDPSRDDVFLVEEKLEYEVMREISAPLDFLLEISFLPMNYLYTLFSSVVFVHITSTSMGLDFSSGTKD